MIKTDTRSSRPRQVSPLSALKPSRKRGTPGSSTTGAAAQDAVASLSVTLISVESMPSYSSERSYLLSEIEQCAQETLFLDDAAAVQARLGPDNNNDHDDTLPHHLVLYLQWHPSLSPDEFLENVLLKHVNRVVSLSSDGAAAGEATRQPPPLPTTAGQDMLRTRRLHNLYVVVDRVDVPPPRQEDLENDKDHDEEALFLFHWHQDDLARALAQRVASHNTLRHSLQGITVAVSNQERAAPGLDACAQVLQVGSEDRYRFGCDGSGSSHTGANGSSETNSQRNHSSSNIDTSKSLIRILATSPDTLLGWHPTLVPGGVSGETTNHCVSPTTTTSPTFTQSSTTQRHNDNRNTTTSISKIPLDQFRVVAEWNAQGNLQTFGQRAHAHWRRTMGLWEQPLCVGPARKPVPRKLWTPPPMIRGVRLEPKDSQHAIPDMATLRRRGYNPALVRQRVQEVATDAAVLCMLGFYFWFHYRHDVSVLYGLLMTSLVDLVQYLRAF